ncbi:MAG: hypothetical protein AAF806_01465 [Bacteroidota bacterium]
MQLVQLFVSHFAGFQATDKENVEIDYIVEEPHFTYQASLPVLSRDWDQSEDDHWDSY